MAYTKTTWVNDSQPAISAENLNNIENGISALDTLAGSTDISAIGDGTVTGAISTLNSDLSGKVIRIEVGARQFNVPANSYATHTVTPTIPNGYAYEKMIASVIQLDPNTNLIANLCRGAGGTFTLYVKNINNVDAIADFVVDYLLFK